MGMYTIKRAHHFKCGRLHHISPLYWGEILNEMASSRMPADLSAYFCRTDQLTVQIHLHSHLRSHSNSRWHAHTLLISSLAHTQTSRLSSIHTYIHGHTYTRSTYPSIQLCHSCIIYAILPSSMSCISLILYDTVVIILPAFTFADDVCVWRTSPWCVSRPTCAPCDWS